MYHVINCKKLHNAVEESMRLLNCAPIVRGENQDQEDWLKELSLLINVEDINEITISKAIPSDLYMLVEYELELLEGVRDFEESWDYTYHQLYSPYFESCIEELKRNNETRRAVLPIAGEKSYGSVHIPCMQVIMFKITDDKLNTTAVFRSNDGVKAFAMNSFAIARLAHLVAHEVGVAVGGYTHIANTFHAYRSDWIQLSAYCKLFDMRKDDSLFYTMDNYMEVYDEYAPEYRKQCLIRRNTKRR